MTRVRVWMWLVAATAVVDVVVAVIGLQMAQHELGLMRAAVANPTPQLVAQLRDQGAAMFQLSAVQTAENLAALVAIIGWLHSGAKLVSDRGLGPLRHSPGWAIGSWFIPVANLVLVPRIAADVYRAGRARPRAGLVIGVWWGLWLLDALMARAALSGTARSIDEAFALMGTVQWSLRLDVLSDVVTIAAVVVTTMALVAEAKRPYVPVASPVHTPAYAAGHWGYLDDEAAAPPPSRAPIALPPPVAVRPAVPAPPLATPQPEPLRPSAPPAPVAAAPPAAPAAPAPVAPAPVAPAVPHGGGGDVFYPQLP